MYSPTGSRYLFACFAVGVLCVLVYFSVVRPILCPPAVGRFGSLTFFRAAEVEADDDVGENRNGGANSTNDEDIVGGPAASEEGRRSKMSPQKPRRHNFRRPNELIPTYDVDVDRRLTELAARRATAGDPQLVGLVRQLLDPPSEHIVKMSRQLWETPQSKEVDKLLASKVNQIRSPRAGFSWGPKRPGPQTSHQYRASHHHGQGPRPPELLNCTRKCANVVSQ